MKPGRWIALAIASLGGGLVLATLGAAQPGPSTTARTNTASRFEPSRADPSRGLR